MFVSTEDRRIARGIVGQAAPLELLPAEGELAGMAARFGAEWDSFVAGHRFFSTERMLGEAVQPHLDAYERETGEALTNPYDLPEFDASTEEHKLGRDLALERVREKYEKARAQPGDRMVSRLPRWPTEEETRQRAIARAQNAEDRAALEARRPGTFMEDVAGFGGTAAAAMTGPVAIGSMLLGAPAGAGIVRFMATEALVGAGTELATQPRVAAWQREIGNEHGFGEIAANVALAGIGSGLFAGLFKGIGKGGAATWQRVRPHLTRDQRAAIHVTGAMDVLDRRNPFEIAKRVGLRSERTGQAPTASFADELRASASDDLVFSVELDRLARELDETLAAAARELDEAAAARAPTVERTEAGDQLVVPGAEQVAQREVLERRMAASDVRGGQAGLEGLGLFDPTSRARQADLLDAPAARAAAPPDPVEASALHMQAMQEAEASVVAGQMPDGPAIRAIDEAFPEGTLELPVWEATTGKGKTIRWRGPMDILTWARTIGGLKDSGGELAARDLQMHNRGRPGVELAKGEVFLGKLVNNDDGVSLDEATLRAWEAGYFPGHAERPTPDDLLEAIDRTIAAGGDVDGRVWSEQDNDLVEQLRGRVDPDAEAHARDIIGDEWVDDAIDTLQTSKIDLNLRADEADLLVDAGDEAEQMALEQLQSELAESDFDILVETVDPVTGQAVPSVRSARETWQDVTDETDAWQTAAGCMGGGPNAT